MERSSEIQNYLAAHFCEESLETERALTCGVKEIWVPKTTARTLYLLAKMVRPRRILEIGTLAGYSALHLARALEPGGKLITIEAKAEHYEKALTHFAGKAHLIDAVCGDAIEVLAEMIERKEEPFDLVFIDGDKAQYPDYLEPAIQLTRSGGVILADNLIPKRGEIGGPDGRDNEAIEIYLFNQLIAQDPRLESHILTTLVGEEGRIDGLGIAVVK